MNNLDDLIQDILDNEKNITEEVKNKTIAEKTKEDVEMKNNKEVAKEVKEVIAEEVTTKKNNKEELKMENNFRYFVLGRNGNVVSAAQIVDTNKISIKEATNGDMEHTFVLCLEEINRIMVLIKEAKGEGDLVNPIQIRTLEGLKNSIDSKNFLFWIRTGSYGDGKALSKRALAAWVEFAKLYKELCLDVVILGHKVSGKNLSMDGKVQRALITQMFKKLPKEVALEETK